MKFRNQSADAPEINLIAFIDVLLVVLIFMVLSTTYSRYSEIQIQLPSADGSPEKRQPTEILVSVASNGNYVINKQQIEARDLDSVQNALEAAMQGSTDSIVVINADAAAAHQSVITVMDSARKAGMSRITFATQSSKRAKSTSKASSSKP